MTAATKKDWSLRICIDPRSLNLALKRGHYHLSVLEDILPDLARAKVFSTVDLSHGYRHCILQEDSSLLTTFPAPFWRYGWTRLLFGLSVSSETFQNGLLQAMHSWWHVNSWSWRHSWWGYQRSWKEPYVTVKTLQRKVHAAQQGESGSESATTELNGTSTDYARFEVKAILKLETAKTKEVINRLNGTLNYLSKFLPKLSRVLEPLRRLTQKGVEFC